MPIQNDSASLLPPREIEVTNDSGNMQAEPTAECAGAAAETVDTLQTSVAEDRLCDICGKELLSYRFGGNVGYGHPQEKACHPFEEQWDAWSLRWLGKLAPFACDRGAGYRLDAPRPSVDLKSGRVLVRQGSPVREADILQIEESLGGKCIWLWAASSKSIFLNSDGYLRVNGKGTVISAATTPVVLDFGPGFMTRDGFVSQVAHVLQHKLINGNLFIKFRWLTHEAFVKELYECPDKFFGLTASSQISTTSSVPPVIVGSVLPP